MAKEVGGLAHWDKKHLAFTGGTDFEPSKNCFVHAVLYQPLLIPILLYQDIC